MLPSDTAVSIRRAQANDIHAIVTLVLTSFRQFALFDYLYRPLREDKGKARDTIWLWRRRVLTGLLDNATDIIVAEAPSSKSFRQRQEQDAVDEAELESWKMLEWVETNYRRNEAYSTGSAKQILGFAIWHDRDDSMKESASRSELKPLTWSNWLQLRFLDFEAYLWSKLYQRKDVDLNRFKEYDKAEDWLSAEFYQQRCYYLDNLAVDFRCQRMGIGEQLLRWGILQAQEKGLHVATEAGERGVGLYRKLGFETIGTWRIADFQLPVMKRKVV